MRPDPARPRLPDWPERLAELLEARLDLPFAWGAQDCCTLPADAALALTGHDPLAAWRGTYADEAAAEAILARHGGLEGFVADCLAAWGAPECPPAFVQRGDWALVAVGNELLCGVVAGAAVAVPGTHRLRAVPLDRIRRAWAV